MNMIRHVSTLIFLTILVTCLKLEQPSPTSVPANILPENNQKSKNLSYLSDESASILGRFAKASLLLKKKVKWEKVQWQQTTDFYCDLIKPENPRLNTPQLRAIQPDAFIYMGTLICQNKEQIQLLSSLCYKKIHVYFL